VDDTATSLLMQRFYQNLLGKRPGLEKPLGKAAALAEAKRWLRTLSDEEAVELMAGLPRGVRRGDLRPLGDQGASARPFEHPYYWASFILIGDPGDVSEAVPVLAEASPVTPASPVERSRWPWVVGCAAVGLVGGLVLVWRRRRSA
jgi:hypothetical protein